MPARKLHPLMMFKWAIKKILPSPAQRGDANSADVPLVAPTNEYVAHRKRGNEFLAQGRLEEAAECYRQAVSVNSRYAEGFLNLGFVSKELKLYEDAEHYLQQAIRMDPAMADAYYLLGGISQERGILDDAIGNYRKALEFRPDFEIVYGDLCRVLFQSGQFESAKTVIKQGLSLNPESAEFHCFLGNLYVYEQEIEKAIACYQKALAIQPDYVVAHSNLGNAFLEQGNVDKAMDCCRNACSTAPDSADAISSLLFAQTHHAHTSADQYLAEARRYGSKVLAQAQPYTSWLTHPADSDILPLRVGLVSGDFRNHPVGYFLESVLAHLNPARIELVAYPTGPQEDELTARIKPRFVAWHPIVGLSDEAAAKKIHDDGTHILIDLAGHTDHNRLPVFAWKPAPVQVSWLGYFASTGVPGMDYLLADPVAVPESHRGHFSETVWYLPDTRLCFTPPAASARLTPTPPPVVQNGFITFGCFQNMSKINDAVLALWGQIFHALPHARLQLHSRQLKSPAAREHLLLRLAQVGIGQERVEIEGPLPRGDYLAAYADVDIILDTFPFPGGTTTCEAMWMGVPTVTLAGNTMLSRQGASLLTCAGLEEWIANTEKDYVALAVARASDVDRLVTLRSDLRQKVLSSPLFDAPRFALNLEEALLGMWRHTHSREIPSHHV